MLYDLFDGSNTKNVLKSNDIDAASSTTYLHVNMQIICLDLV